MSLRQKRSIRCFRSSINPIDAVVLLELDDAVLIERLLSRGRDDDNEAVIRNRLVVYADKTEPLIDHYKQRGLLQTVDASGSIEAITERIEGVLARSLW